MIEITLVRICRVANLTGSEFIALSTRILPHLRSNKMTTMCLCGKPEVQTHYWVAHGCAFEEWLISNGIGRFEQNQIFFNHVIDWREVEEKTRIRQANRPRPPSSTSWLLEK
jgi:hypothetical protein